jgi:hypothetical protein
MIAGFDAMAREVAQQLLAEGKAGKRETIDVDDVIAALRERSDAPKDPAAFERLLERTLRRLIEAI